MLLPRRSWGISALQLNMVAESNKTERLDNQKSGTDRRLEGWAKVVHLASYGPLKSPGPPPSAKRERGLPVLPVTDLREKGEVVLKQGPATSRAFMTSRRIRLVGLGEQRPRPKEFPTSFLGMQGFIDETVRTAVGGDHGSCLL